MYKMVVFDLDGTLLQSNYELSELNKKVIRELKKKGTLVSIATGRPNELIKEYVDELEIDAHVITCNGSVIYNHKTKDVLYSKTLEEKELRELYHYARSNDIDLLIYGPDFIACNLNERYEFFTKRNEGLREDLRGNFILVDDHEEMVLKSDINKILYIEHDTKKYFETLAFLEKYEDISVTRSKKEFIDIGPLEISKGDAVKRLALYHGIDSSKIIVFGDQYNDVSMFRVAGLSVAMGNAIEDVKKEADRIAVSNDEDGVYHLLSDLLEKGQL